MQKQFLYEFLVFLKLNSMLEHQISCIYDVNINTLCTASSTVTSCFQTGSWSFGSSRVSSFTSGKTNHEKVSVFLKRFLHLKPTSESSGHLKPVLHSLAPYPGHILYFSTTINAQIHSVLQKSSLLYNGTELKCSWSFGVGTKIWFLQLKHT